MVIIQDEVIDLTMEDTDDENMEKSHDNNSATTKKGKGRLNNQASTPRKKLIQKDLHYFIQVQSLHPRKSLVSTKIKRNLQKSQYSSKLPADNTTLTQIYKPSK